MPKAWAAAVSSRERCRLRPRPRLCAQIRHGWSAASCTSLPHSERDGLSQDAIAGCRLGYVTESRFDHDPHRGAGEALAETAKPDAIGRLARGEHDAADWLWPPADEMGVAISMTRRTPPGRR